MTNFFLIKETVYVIGLHTAMSLFQLFDSAVSRKADSKHVNGLECLCYNKSWFAGTGAGSQFPETCFRGIFPTAGTFMEKGSYLFCLLFYNLDQSVGLILQI